MRKKPIVPKPDDQLTREELLEEVAYLRAETAYLKKLDALILHEQTAMRESKRKPSKD
jgi:transposase